MFDNQKVRRNLQFRYSLALNSYKPLAVSPTRPHAESAHDSGCCKGKVSHSDCYMMCITSRLMQLLTGLLLRYFCVATCPQQEMPCPGLRLAAMKQGRGLLRVVPGLRTQCWIASQLAQILGLMSGHEEPLPIRPRMPNALGHEDVRKDRAAEPLPYKAQVEHPAACRLSAELWSDSWRCLKRGLAYIIPMFSLVLS
jgi:hypothetical protein